MNEKNFQLINIQLIDRPDPPVRIAFVEEEIAALAASIAREGILVPLLVRKRGDRYEIIDGDSRLEAAYRNRLAEVPCVVRDATDRETHILRLVSNQKRSNPDVVSDALYYATLISGGVMTQEELAAELGRSEQWVADHIAIADMPEYMTDALRAKTLPLGVALALVQVDHEATRQRYVYSALQNGMTVRAATDAVREYEKLRDSQTAGGTIPDEMIFPADPIILKYPCAACGAETRIEDLRFVRVCKDGCSPADNT